MENPKRLIIAIVLLAILVPVIFGSYGIIGEDSPEAILAKLIQAIPFGDSMLKIVLLPVSDAMSSYDTFSDWLKAQGFSVPQHLAMEIGKFVFSGAILMLVEKIIIPKLKGRGGFLDSVADFLIITLAVFVSGWLTDLLIDCLDSMAVMDLSGRLRDAMTYIYSGILGVGSIALIMLASVLFVDALLSVSLSCFKMTVTYMGIICVLAYYAQTGSILLSAVGFVAWFVLIIGIYQGERKIL